MKKIFDYLKRYRWISSIYFLWAFSNIILFLRNPTFNNDGKTFIFNPFEKNILISDNWSDGFMIDGNEYDYFNHDFSETFFKDHYDFAELVFHLTFPLVCFIIFKFFELELKTLFKKDKSKFIKKQE